LKLRRVPERDDERWRWRTLWKQLHGNVGPVSQHNIVGGDLQCGLRQRV
jgi:hypothetical protein